MVGGFCTGVSCALAMGWNKKEKTTHKPKIERILIVFIVLPLIFTRGLRYCLLRRYYEMSPSYTKKAIGLVGKTEFEVPLSLETISKYPLIDYHLKSTPFAETCQN